MTQPSESIFQSITEFPDADYGRRYASLVGLDAVKDRLVKEARIIVKPKALEDWSRRNYGTVLPVANLLRRRSPLFVFAGDVGTGKTALARSFGDEVARQEKISVTLYELSLGARGSGAVGEMTRLIAGAFSEFGQAASRGGGDSASSAAILFIDEADALAQSREMSQMHHEDRAGVNALIRGIDSLSPEKTSAIVVMCTNRLSALDPAVLRRAAAVFSFSRPNDEQRLHLLARELEGVGLSDGQLRELARITGPTEGRNYGFTYSDLVHRLLPDILLDAFPDNQITFERALILAAETAPTSPFQGEE